MKKENEKPIMEKQFAEKTSLENKSIICTTFFLKNLLDFKRIFKIFLLERENGYKVSFWGSKNSKIRLW